MMLCSILYKVVILLYFLLVLRDSHPSSCKSFVTDPGSLEYCTVEPVLGDPWFGRPLVLGDHNHRHGSFLTIKYLA